MRMTFKACQQAMLTALINGTLALALMFLIEFAISGHLHLTGPYLWAGVLICLVIFSAQFYRQLKLCRCDQYRSSAEHHSKPL
ncbi:MAG: hypothetical protein WD623_14735 [Marinobacter sp.]|uniref:hypothetical protein n=1 Tax=Marinobacter sp. TaxID=50741 RepID=UPI00349FEE40